MGATTCNEKGCDRVVVAKGLCITHYYRKRRGSTRANPEVRVYDAALVMLRTKVRPELHAALEREAKDTKSSTYEVVRQILEEWYELHHAEFPEE